MKDHLSCLAYALGSSGSEAEVEAVSRRPLWGTSTNTTRSAENSRDGLESAAGREPWPGELGSIPRPSRRQPLSEEAAASARGLILSGALRVGEYVRAERLAEELDMSITPVREGLMMLSAEGFVTFEPRRGFVVAPLSPSDISDLFYMQANLGGELAARAVANLYDAKLDEILAIQATLSTVSKYRTRLEDVAMAYRTFHEAINAAADSPKLAWFLALAVRCIPAQFMVAIEGWVPATVEDHHQIIGALATRDAEAARQAMAAHYLRSGDMLVAHLGPRLSSR
jgi:DNA-binding GntR family transcriptional regulator